MRRPERVLRFAWNPNAAPDGGAVEPPTGEAEGGWSRGQRPAAQYLNAILNNHGSWVDFLRGPSLSRWARAELPGTLDTGSSISIAADRESAETDAVLRRLVIAGEDGSGSCVYISQRGGEWVRRNNFPAGTAGEIKRTYFHAGFWYLVVDNGTSGRLLTSPADQVAGTALDGGADWDFVSIASGGPRAMAFYDASGTYTQVTATSTSLYVLQGPTPGPGGTTPASIGGTTPVGAFTDVAHDGDQFIAVTADGYVVTGTAPVDFAGLSGRITTETGMDWRLSAGASGEVVAWRSGEAVDGQHYWRTTDHGVSWEEITPTSGPGLVTSLVYEDGLWVATSTVVPHVWSSNDLVAWSRAKTPTIIADNALAYGAVLSEGAWVVVRPATALVGDRAEDLTPGSWTVDPTPTVLGNAGWLGGVRITLTTPTDLEVLAYDAGSGRYVPAGVGTLLRRAVVASLGAGAEGDVAFATDGRKVGEGAGLGTGVPVYWSDAAWRRYSDDAAVTA